jgi:hypothetical protein
MKTTREYIMYVGLGLVLCGSVFVMSVDAYTLEGNPPLPEVRGIPSYLAAVTIGTELVQVTSEQTGRTFVAIVEKNVSGATYTVRVEEISN